MERWYHIVALRLRSLFEWQQIESELEQEIRDHLEQLTQNYLAQGLDPQRARDAALREFGGVEQAKEKCRAARKVNWIEQ